MITSPANPLVKDLVRLRTRRHRDATGRFVIEGERTARMAAAAGVHILTQVVAPDLGGVPIEDVDADVIEMAETPFLKASIGRHPDGILLVAAHLPTSLGRIRPGPAALVLLVEGVEKPGNLGGMLRTADAVGADAVVVGDPATDIHNPNVVRASQGALFTVPVGVSTIEDALAWLADGAIDIVATTPHAEQSIWAADLGGAIAVAVGSEALGLSDTVLEAATRRATIPMRGSVDSLNASVAAAVVLYEAARRRG